MSLNDTIADMLTRIRNAAANQRTRVDCLNSKICRGIAEVLKSEGYINDFEVIEDGRQGLLRIELKYGSHGEMLIHQIKRQSKPGRRVYVKSDKLPRPLSGLGISIVSTPSGVLSDRQCREKRVGGELLCTVE
ncbi:MAG: 30S ribosomal protein S8 [Phycisphaeraceae bacterium]|nr:30S ribosomal protein S8 [Phycisphaeraceae bacterium]